MVLKSDLFTKCGRNESPLAKSKPSRLRLANLLPIALLLAFVLLVLLLFGERMVPVRDVQLESVVTQRIQQVHRKTVDGQSRAVDDFSGKALFQASGWIEADPLPIYVAALNDGFVDSVHVLEGETVTIGQLLAKLVDDDAVLNLASAKARHNERAAALTERQAMVRLTRASLRRLSKEIDIEEARLNELLDDEKRLLTVSLQSVPEQAITQARLRVLTQSAVIQALRAKQAELESELAARSAVVKRTAHELDAAETDLARKQLALDRMEIRSPVNGIIQKIYVSPGLKRMAGMDDPKSSAVVQIFDPDSLQARIDVPLEEAAQLLIDQPVRLRSVFLPDTVFKGRVTRIDGQADLQRNTLQAKVQLLNTSNGLRPEMLCRAEFLAAATTGRANPIQSIARAAVYIPANALVERLGAYFVWTLDASGKRLTLQAIQLDSEEQNGYWRIKTGLKPGARVVIHPPDDLKEGDRIHN